MNTFEKRAFRIMLTRNLVSWTLILLVFIFAFSVSCTHEPDELMLNDTICFNSQVLPLLLNTCGTSGCHDPQTAEEGFVAADYTTIRKAVKPGSPRESKLYRVTTDLWGENFMPPDQPLTPEQRNIIQLWILQGAENTECDTAGTNGNGNPPGPDPEPIDSLCFVQDILPVFASSCGTTGCHDPMTHQEGYNLTDYTGIMSSEEGIIPFNANASKFIKVLTNADDDRMPPPPRAPLSSEQIAMLKQWINEGALNSDCPETGCDTLSTISYTNQVAPILQTNCVACHTSPEGNAGVFLDSYTHVKSVAETDVAGTSLLVGTIRRMNGFLAMPPYSPLSECSVRTIELWIEQGLLNN